MEENKCGGCVYFCRHYVAWRGGTYLPIDCGHCIYARTKQRRPGTRACIHFDANLRK